IHRLVIAFVIATLPMATLFSQSAAPAAGAPQPAASASGVDLTALNRTVDPCTDFFQFACGGWPTANPIPGDPARRGPFHALPEKNDTILRRVLDSASTSRDAADKKIGDYYASCMDEAGIERLGVTPVEPDLKNAAALSAVGRLPELVAELHKIGVNVFFGF